MADKGNGTDANHEHYYECIKQGHAKRVLAESKKMAEKMADNPIMFHPHRSMPGREKVDGKSGLNNPLFWCVR